MNVSVQQSLASSPTDDTRPIGACGGVVIFALNWPPMVRAPAKRLVRNDVRAWRCKRALTQEDLARQTGVTRQTIMNVEHGRTGPSIFLAYRIAAALDVPVTTLFRP
jgi:putative transcriptional regulator